MQEAQGMKGVCCTCQTQQPVYFDRSRDEEMFELEGKEFCYLIAPHQPFNSDWCEGADTTPQAVFRDED